MNLRRMFARGDIAKSSAQTVGATALMLALNLITGVMVARLLGATGRGQIAAVITLGQTIGWAATMGCFQAVVFYNSREPESAPTTIGTWMALALPLGLVGIVVGELLVGPLFSAQTDQTVMLARLWVLMVPLMPLSEALSGALVADRDFTAMNLLKLLQSAMPVVVYVLLWATGNFTVAAVLITQVTVIAVYLALLTARTLRRHKLARPRLADARRGLYYGVRAQASNIGTQLNARLDLLILPAFLVAAQVGLYAVAVSISTMIVTLAGSLAMIALPLAATGDKNSSRRVAQMLHATMTIGISMAAAIVLLAPELLNLVYSSRFSGATVALRLLAPGAVVQAMTNIVVSGLYGQERPAAAGWAQVPGIAFTAVGLALFLRSGGIDAAALISTIAYSLTFATATIAFMRRAEIGWGQLFDVRPTLALAVRRVRSRAGLRAASAGEVGG